MQTTLKNHILRENLGDVPFLPARDAMPRRHYALDLGEWAFNPGMLNYQNRTLIAWRHGYSPAKLRIGELTEDHRLAWGKPLEFSHLLPKSELKGSFEDPRLIDHDGQLLMTFSHQNPGASMGWMTLGPDFQPTSCSIFQNPSGRWEKNWGFFSQEGQLFAVYTLNPHVVAVLNGEGFSLRFHSERLFRWQWGEPRGGTPPVRVGSEYFSFFHSRHNGTYYAGFYAFEAVPPFRVTRWPSAPCLIANPHTRGAVTAWNVVFPTAAILSAGVWLVGYGLQDSFTCLARYRHSELVSSLTDVRSAG